MFNRIKKFILKQFTLPELMSELSTRFTDEQLGHEIDLPYFELSDVKCIGVLKIIVDE